MPDQRIVEAHWSEVPHKERSPRQVLASIFGYLRTDGPEMDGEEWADLALAALRDAGYAWYRPDDCAPVLLSSHMSQTFARCGRKDAEYLLVSVGSDS